MQGKQKPDKHVLALTVDFTYCVCVTWQDQGDAPRADPPVLGAVSEGAQAQHHTGEAAQHRQQHEGPGGIPEGWTQTRPRTTHTSTHKH